MTVCEICGGDQFTLQDGFYFCDECHTQSQDIREIVTDDMYVQGATEVRKVVISEKTLADRRRRKEVKAEMRGVRTALSITASLNQLLRRWTAALVARGAPVQLPDVTAQLWEAVLRAETRRLTIRSAVAVLWLALVDCEPLCRVSDLLRWARQGVTPVYSAFNELPEDVSTNWPALTLSRPLSAVKMRDVLHRMVRRLRLPPPSQPPLRQLLRRLLPELMLPAQLVDVVANVARRAPPLDRYLPEADALALLLVTLKMLLGLDDATEIRNSEVAAARNEAEPDGPRWFVFSEWLEFVRQQRAAAGEQDFLELDVDDRQLLTVSGPDLCRRRHRQLLFDFYECEGTFRCNVELPGRRHLFKAPDYKLNARKLFGRPEAPAAPPPTDRDDLLCPAGSRLEREGGEALRQAESFRHSRVEFLLDESYVRKLQSEGVPVAVTYAAARRRVPMQQKTVRLRFSRASCYMAQDVELVDERSRAIPPEKAPPPCRRRPRRDLWIFMPCGEVWCLPAVWASPPPSTPEYRQVAVTWPASFRYLMDVLAATIELRPVDFAFYVVRAEKNVFEVLPQVCEEIMKRRINRTKGRRERVKKKDGKTENSARKTKRRKMSEEMEREDGKTENSARTAKRRKDVSEEAGKNVFGDLPQPFEDRMKRRGERKGRKKRVEKEDGKTKNSARKTKRRRNVSDEASTTDVSSVEMELVSETETDAEADMTHSPELFSE